MAGDAVLNQGGRGFSTPGKVLQLRSQRGRAPHRFEAMLATTTEKGTVTTALKQTVAALRAADAMQLGMVAEQLFETSWILDRRKLYRGMTKDEARDAFKADFLKEMQEKAAVRPVVALADAGSVAGALRSAVDALKVADEGMPELMEQAIDLRLEAQGLA